jgi:hypothetical protein
MDRAVYAAVQATPSPRLDVGFHRLSTAANRSRLWLGMAGVLAVAGGRRGRHAALAGVLSIGTTSAMVNLGIKPVARRQRPTRVESRDFADRYVTMPARAGASPGGRGAQLDGALPGGPTRGEITVRDALVHLIEEYARHLGHADILREPIDGRVAL